jgi:small-conductance mechanosensitive channel
MKFLTELISQPLIVFGIIVVLIAYWRIAARSANLPHIPLGLFILYLLVVLCEYFFEFYGVPEWSKKIEIVGTIVIYCALARLIFYLAVDVWVSRRQKIAVPRITRDVALAIIFAVIAIVLLHTKGGVNLASLLTTSAVLTMVVGLALQDTLGNLFAGLALQTEKLFQIGEWISFKEHTGQVIGMTWKSTLIKTFEHEVVYIPNNIISKEIVKNFSRPEPQHVAYLDIGVEYGAAPNKVRKVIIDTLNEHPKVLKDPPPQVRLISFDDFFIKYQVRFWNRDFEGERLLKAELMNTLWYSLKRNGIQIPFPIRDVHLHHIDVLEEKRSRELAQTEIKARLKKIPILELLPQEDIGLLASRVSPGMYGDGEAIVHQGCPGDSMYIISHGDCDIYIKGVEKPIATLIEGDFFGEMSLLTGEPRSATVVAKGDTKVFEIDKESCADILKAHPAIWDTLGQALARRQADLAAKQGKKAEPSPSAASQIVSRIKSFFGIG